MIFPALKVERVEIWRDCGQVQKFIFYFFSPSMCFLTYCSLCLSDSSRKHRPKAQRIRACAWGAKVLSHLDNVCVCVYACVYSNCAERSADADLWGSLGSWSVASLRDGCFCRIASRCLNGKRLCFSKAFDEHVILKHTNRLTWQWRCHIIIN